MFDCRLNARPALPVWTLILIAASLAFASLPPKLLGDNATKLAGAVCYALAIWTATFAVIV